MLLCYCVCKAAVRNILIVQFLVQMKYSKHNKNTLDLSLVHWPSLGRVLSIEAGVFVTVLKDVSEATFFLNRCKFIYSIK